LGDKVFYEGVSVREDSASSGQEHDKKDKNEWKWGVGKIDESRRDDAKEAESDKISQARCDRRCNIIWRQNQCLV
jgi:hypothetical protein